MSCCDDASILWKKLSCDPDYTAAKLYENALPRKVMKILPKESESESDLCDPNDESEVDHEDSDGEDIDDIQKMSTIVRW